MKQKISYLIILALLFGSTTFVAARDEILSSWQAVAFGIFIGSIFTLIAIELSHKKQSSKEK
ncbi:MAG TPA: hypothetical protein VJ965_07830 [Anaerolineales bacterium]|nr:hypothetical protein [Anaerolineales bacterium]